MFKSTNFKLDQFLRHVRCILYVLDIVSLNTFHASLCYISYIYLLGIQIYFDMDYIEMISGRFHDCGIDSCAKIYQTASIPI